MPVISPYRVINTINVKYPFNIKWYYTLNYREISTFVSMGIQVNYSSQQKVDFYVLKNNLYTLTRG